MNDNPLIQREPIFTALFALVAAAAPFTTVSRRLKHWVDVEEYQQPALYMAQGTQSARTERGKPTIWTLSASLYVYARTTGEQTPGAVMNPILDAIENALQPNAQENAQTLGGLVTWCRIEGNIETDEGTLGDQMVAIIPITILVS